MSAPAREPIPSLEVDPALAPVPAPAAPAHRSGRWIDHWDPEDPTFWRGGGRPVARRNLGLSVFAEFLGFCVWALWSVVVPLLPAAGFSLTLDQQFWLIAVPSLVGATVRIPYTFAVPRVRRPQLDDHLRAAAAHPGRRPWPGSSREPDTSFGVLLACAALAGFGGGNFASSMTNISFFFPEAEKGKALGLNAAGGNLGTGIVQMVVPAVIVIGAGIAPRAGRADVHPAGPARGRAGLARAWTTCPASRPTTAASPAATRNRHTWIISFLYIGTFGSFIGYSGAFPTLLKTQFPEVTDLHRLPRRAGRRADPAARRHRRRPVRRRPGDHRARSWCWPSGAVGAIVGLQGAQLRRVLLLASWCCSSARGIGNGATYRMIPAVFRAGVTATTPGRSRRKAAAGCIGIAGAVGAYGGFFIPRGFAMAKETLGSLVPALWVFVAAYCSWPLTTYAVYARRGSALAAATI